MLRIRPLLLAMTVVLAACAQAPQKPEPVKPVKVAAAAPVVTNPLFSASTLQYQAPPFDKITDADYQPAIEEGIKQHLAEIDKIANNAAAPTFDNTIVAMERSGALYIRATKIFDAVAQANTDATLQKVQAEEAPKRAAHDDAIFLNPQLFARVKSIYDHRDSLDAPSKFLSERYYQQIRACRRATHRGQPGHAARVKHRRVHAGHHVRQ